MARFGDNPVKSPLAGNELIPATDPSSGDDICLTPDILTDFALANFPLATSTGNGLMSSVEFNRIYDTYTIAEIDAKTDVLKIEPIGFYVGTVANGYIEFFCNLLEPLTIVEAFFRTASGTVTCSVQIGGVSVTGLSAIAVTSAGQQVTATALNSMVNGSKLGLLFASNSSALGFYVTISVRRTVP
jgi:hypothetical protein